MINLIIGVLIGVGIMCFLQINRLNEMQNRINKAIKYIKENRYITEEVTDNDSLYYCECITLYAFNDDNVMELMEILGGDVDDE